MSIVIHISDDTHTDKGHERIEESTAARLAFVRDYLFRSADASSRPDIGDRDTGRGCGRMVDVGSGFSGAQLKGLRTLKSPGVPASAAFAVFVAQRVVSFVVRPSTTEIEESRHVYKIPGTVVRLRVQLRVRVRAYVAGTDAYCQIADKRVLPVYRRFLLSVLNQSRSTLS